MWQLSNFCFFFYKPFYTQLTASFHIERVFVIRTQNKFLYLWKKNSFSFIISWTKHRTESSAKSAWYYIIKFCYNEICVTHRKMVLNISSSFFFYNYEYIQTQNLGIAIGASLVPHYQESMLNSFENNVSDQVSGKNCFFSKQMILIYAQRNWIFWFRFRNERCIFSLTYFYQI